jgi:hypothetical protein
LAVKNGTYGIDIRKNCFHLSPAVSSVNIISIRESRLRRSRTYLIYLIFLQQRLKPHWFSQRSAAWRQPAVNETAIRNRSKNRTLTPSGS